VDKKRAYHHGFVPGDSGSTDLRGGWSRMAKTMDPKELPVQQILGTEPYEKLQKPFS